MGGQTSRLEQNLNHGYLRRGCGEWLTPHCWTSPCSEAAAAGEGLLDAQSTIVSEMTGRGKSPSKSTPLCRQNKRFQRKATTQSINQVRKSSLEVKVGWHSPSTSAGPKCLRLLSCCDGPEVEAQRRPIRSITLTSPQEEVILLFITSLQCDSSLQGSSRGKKSPVRSQLLQFLKCLSDWVTSFLAVSSFGHSAPSLGVMCSDALTSPRRAQRSAAPSSALPVLCSPKSSACH